MENQERSKAVTLKGAPLTLIGPQLKVGDRAPDFTATGNDLQPAGSKDLKGKVRVLVSVTSLDTPICDLEARRFNQEAAKIGDVEVVILSADLPFAQKRFCGAAGLDKVSMLSDYKDNDFGRSYGTLIKELRLLSRAVFVIDAEDRVTYAEYVPEIAQHPDYDAVLGHLRNMVKA